MHDQPEATPDEEERAPEEQGEHEAMRGPGHDDPPDVAQDDSEIHDA